MLRCIIVPTRSPLVKASRAAAGLTNMGMNPEGDSGERCTNSIALLGVDAVRLIGTRVLFCEIRSFHFAGKPGSYARDHGLSGLQACSAQKR